MGKQMRITKEDYLKAHRKMSRQEEITAHGHPVRIGAVHRSKKVYNRKRSKAEMKKALPYFFVFYNCFLLMSETEEIENGLNKMFRVFRTLS